VKFGIGVLYKKFSTKREFPENRRSDIRALLTGVVYVCPSFPCVFADLGYIRCSESPRDVV